MLLLCTCAAVPAPACGCKCGDGRCPEDSPSSHPLTALPSHQQSPYQGAWGLGVHLAARQLPALEFQNAGCQSTASSTEPNIWHSLFSTLQCAKPHWHASWHPVHLCNQFLVSEICLGAAACFQYGLNGRPPGRLGQPDTVNLSCLLLLVPQTLFPQDGHGGSLCIPLQLSGVFQPSSGMFFSLLLLEG